MSRCQECLRFILSRYSWTSLTAFAFTVSCTVSERRPDAHPSEFQRRTVAESCLPSSSQPFSLKRAGAIPYEVCAKTFPEENDENYSIHYNISFPKLTEEQYRTLGQAYGSSRRFDPSRSRYSLTEFLPPAMEALNGLNFRVQSLEIPAEAAAGIRELHPEANWTKVFAQTNCWSTVYSILAAKDDQFTAFFAEQDQLRNVFSNRDFFEQIPIAKQPVSDKNGQLRQEMGAMLQPMDVILISVAGTIIHAAFYIDQELFFEKTGTDDSFAYRLVPFSVIQKIYPESYQKVEFFRFKKRAELPHPSDLFSLEAQFGNRFGKYGREISAYRFPLEGKNEKGFFNLSRIKNLNLNDLKSPDGIATLPRTFEF